MTPSPKLAALIKEIEARRALCPGTLDEITAVHVAAKRLARDRIAGRATALTPQAAEMVRTVRLCPDYDDDEHPGAAAMMVDCTCGSSFLIWSER